MDRHEHVVVGQRGDHGDADAKHGQDHGGHRPVQQPREGGELAAFGWHRHSPLPTSAGVIALGCFVSPARRVNDCEYTAERRSSSGSSDGAMPAGNTRGSKLMSRRGTGVVTLDSIERQRSHVHLFPLLRPGDGGVVGRVARLPDDDDEMPPQRLAVNLLRSAHRTDSSCPGCRGGVCRLEGCSGVSIQRTGVDSPAALMK